MPEKTRTFASKLASLRAGEEILWIHRRKWAGEACRRLLAAAAPPSASELVLQLAQDPKWEVRAVIAENLAELPDPLFREVVKPLVADDNPFVARAAKIALSRRTPVARPSGRSRHAGLQRLIEEIRRKHGADAGKLAVKLANRQSDDYLRSMAHDVNTTLTSIKDAVACLKKSEIGSSPPVQMAVSLIAPRVEDLQSLTKAINEFSRPVILRRTEEACEQMIEDAVRAARNSIAERGGDASGVCIDVTVDASLTVLVSRSHVVMALTNLIKNAIEAHERRDGFREGKVTIDAHADPHLGILNIFIADTGGEIDPLELAKLREGIPGGSSKPTGNGFGLPRARRYIEQHGGTIKIEPNDNVGLRLRIQIPV